MLEKTNFSNGKDNFKDYTFSAQEWSAPTMVCVAEIKERLASFNLVGRKIERMKMIGLAYNLRRDYIEECAYNFWDKLEEDERQKCSEYENIDSSIEIYRYAEIDEPFLIGFEDGDIFEIDAPQEPEFRMSMNCIPWGIDAGTNMPNAEADIVFEPCIGKLVESVEVKTYMTDQDPMYRGYFDEKHSERELVAGIILWLENGMGLLFEGDIDFCDVSLIDKTGKNIPISFGNLKPSLFNLEDLNIDALTGFEADSYTLKFGKLGAEHTSEPYMTIVPENKETKLFISVDDFILFDWAISIYTKSGFDEYGEYDFSCTQWHEILEIARRIVSFDSFDDLFEFFAEIEITGYNIIGGSTYRIMLNSINCCGANFWNHLNRYKTQLNDMCKWTELVLSQNEKINIYGF